MSLSSVTIKGDAPAEPEDPTVEVQETANGGVQVVTDEQQAAQPEEATPAEERPEWLPEKFKSPADLAKAYAALEAKLGERPAAADGDEAEAAVAAAGLDFDALTAEFEESGALSDDTYQALEKGGIPKNVADAYIAGQQALAEKQTATLAQDVGGEENLQPVLQWAEQNLSESEKASYNAAVDRGDIDSARLSLRGIYAQYVADVGAEPHLVSGTPPRGGNVAPFASQAEIVASMRDPKYQSDPAYRKQVEQRLAVTEFNG